jgi:hypothetical protein
MRPTPGSLGACPCRATRCRGIAMHYRMILAAERCASARTSSRVATDESRSCVGSAVCRCSLHETDGEACIYGLTDPVGVSQQGLRSTRPWNCRTNGCQYRAMAQLKSSGHDVR